MYTDEQNKKSFEEEEQERKGNNGKIILLIACIVVFLVLLALILWPTIFKEEDPKITITNKNLTVDVGKTVKIESTFNKKNIDPTYKSDDEKIVKVDGNGVITGVLEGTTSVDVIYKYKNKDYSDKVYIKVNKVEEDSENNSSSGSGSESGTTVKKTVSLEYSIEGNKDLSKWQTTDVTINVKATNQNKLVYAVDCSGTCNYTNVVGNKIIFGETGTHKITIEASNSSGSSKKQELTVKIDNTPPTCQLAYQSGKIVLTTNDNLSGMAYYGESSGYTGTNADSKTATAGTHTYYVSDVAGNKNSCTIKLVEVTQYRSRNCTACKTCKNAGCAEWWVCHKTEQDGKTVSCGTGCVISGGECKSNCKTYKANCSTCGGCSTWENWSAWQNEAITSSDTKQVDTQKILTVSN